LRSPYSLDKPPPSEPPPGVLCPSLWPVQVRWWRRHTPKDKARTCAVCGQGWPCHSWACWDGQIGDAVAAAEQHQLERRKRRAAKLSSGDAAIPSPRPEHPTESASSQRI